MGHYFTGQQGYIIVVGVFTPELVKFYKQFPVDLIQWKILTFNYCLSHPVDSKWLTLLIESLT